MAREGVLLGARQRHQLAVPAHAGARQGESVSGRRAASRERRARHRPHAHVRGSGRVRRLRREASAGRHALRNGAARRRGARHARELGAAGRTDAGASRVAARARAATGGELGGVPERRFAEAARRRALPLRALVRRAPALRRPARGPVLQGRALAHAERSADRRDRDAAPLRRPGLADPLPAAAGRDDDRRQDPHPVRAVARADGAPPRALPRGRLAGDAVPELRGRRRIQPVRRLRRDPAAQPLPVPARRRALLRGHLHPRSGLPGAGRGGRDRGPVLGVVPRSRPRSLDHEPRVPREDEGAAEPAVRGRRLARLQPQAAQVPERARALLRRGRPEAARPHARLDLGRRRQRIATRCSRCSATSTTQPW